MGFSVFDVRSLEGDFQEFLSSGTPGEVVASVCNPGREQCLMSCIVTSTDTVDRVLYLHTTGASYEDRGIIAGHLIPALAGQGVVPAVDLAAEIPATPAGLLLARQGFSFGWSVPVNPTSGKTIAVTSILGIF